MIASVLLAIGSGIVGFLDDFIKIKLKRNKGLSAKQKTLGQIIITVSFVATLWISHNTVWYVPFMGTINFEQNPFTAVLFWIISIIIIYGCINSVNLTDGIDGLCSSVTATARRSMRLSLLELESGKNLYGRYRFAVPWRNGCGSRLLH